MSLAIVVGTVLIGALGFGAYIDLVPSARILSPVTEEYQVGPADAYQVGFGYLDAAGVTVVAPSCPLQSESMPDDGPPPDPEAWWRQCLVEAGVVANYGDYVLADLRTRLTLTLAGIGTAVAAAGLGLGWWRIRRPIR